MAVRALSVAVLLAANLTHAADAGADLQPCLVNYHVAPYDTRYSQTPDIGDGFLLPVGGGLVHVDASYAHFTHVWSGQVERMWKLGGRVFFNGSSVFAQRQELWVTDGTYAGTHMVRAGELEWPLYGYGIMIKQQPDTSFLPRAALGSLVLWGEGINGYSNSGFFTQDATLGPALPPGLKPGSDQGYDLEADELLAVTDAAHGRELWAIDPQGPQAVLVADLVPGPESSDPRNFTLLRPGLTVFFARGPSGGTMLWRTDGTAPGTVPVKLVSEIFGSIPKAMPLGILQGSLIFATSGSGTIEIWRTDGTPEGTYRVTTAGVTHVGVGSMRSVPLGGKIFFTNNDGVGRQAVWATDGTVDGTGVLADFTQDPVKGEPHNPFALDGALYFERYGLPSHLLRSDGTAQGTVVVDAAGSLRSARTLAGRVTYTRDWDGASSTHWALCSASHPVSQTRFLFCPAVVKVRAQDAEGGTLERPVRPSALVAGVPTTNITLSAPLSGRFPMGRTLVTASVTDPNTGEQATCEISVEVVDLDPPVLQCPSTLVLPAPGFPEIEITATDNLSRIEWASVERIFVATRADLKSIAFDAAGNLTWCVTYVTVARADPSPAPDAGVPPGPPQEEPPPQEPSGCAATAGAPWAAAAALLLLAARRRRR